jgi:hypothetical protein
MAMGTIIIGQNSGAIDPHILLGIFKDIAFQ